MQSRCTASVNEALITASEKLGDAERLIILAAFAVARDKAAVLRQPFRKASRSIR
jgi:hypothetical protein